MHWLCGLSQVGSNGMLRTMVRRGPDLVLLSVVEDMS